jgi:uncharacterized protein (TIGR03435 family)
LETGSLFTLQRRLGVNDVVGLPLTINPAVHDVPPVAIRGVDSRSDLFTAMREQLGLKLESSKGQVDVLVIDHVEHSTEN